LVLNLIEHTLLLVVHMMVVARIEFIFSPDVEMVSKREDSRGIPSC